MDQTKKFDEIMDMLDNRESGSSGRYGSFFNDEDE